MTLCLHAFINIENDIFKRVSLHFEKGLATLYNYVYFLDFPTNENPTCLVR